MKSTTSDRVKIPPGFWEGLRQLGITSHDVVRSAGLPLTVITDPIVTSAQYFAIWHAYSDLMGDTAKGIVELATVFETAQYPPTVLAPYHARDFRDALQRMSRYKQMCPPEGVSGNHIGMSSGARPEGHRPTIDGTVGRIFERHG